MKRALLIVALAFAGDATAASNPHAQARAYLLKCRTALAAVHFGPVTRKTEPAVRKPFTAAVAACNAGKKLEALAFANGAEQALTQAANAELGVADGLQNYGKYLTDVAAGKKGHTKILNYAVEEIRQARILIGVALSELK
jgi:hypothetical protein